MKNIHPPRKKQKWKTNILKSHTKQKPQNKQNRRRYIYKENTSKQQTRKKLTQTHKQHSSTSKHTQAHKQIHCARKSRQETDFETTPQTSQSNSQLLKRSQSSEWSICNGCDLVVVQVPTH
jgi:hypothetical protein